MADEKDKGKEPKISAEAQKQVDNFKKELGNINDLIVDLGQDLGDNLVKSLTKSITELKKIKDPLKEAESISRKLNELIDDNALLQNQLAISEKNYTKSLQSGNKSEIQKAAAKNNQLRANIEINQALLLELASLKEVGDIEVKITGEKQKQNRLLEEAKKLFADSVKPLTELFSVVGILKAIVGGANNFDKASVNISKNFGYSAGQANDVARNFQAISLTSNNTAVNLKTLAEASNDLAASTGLVSEYSADTLETQVMLTKQFGLTGEEAAGIYKFSVLTGQSSSEVNDAMVKSFVNARNTLKVGANFKAVMAEAAKVSGQLAANLGNNPEKIVKAIVQAKALGTTLEQTKNQSKQLLEFGESIENELKAELLTGQQINLERARAYALQGDMVGVMKELANQGMTIQKFNNMNVLAQEAYAKALGLSADQLAEQLTKQKLAQESGKSLAQINEEEAKEAQKRQTIQDKFNNTVEKLKDIIGSIGVALAPIVQAFAWIVDHTFVLYGLLIAIAIAKLPAIAKGFSGIVDNAKLLKDSIKSAFSGEGIKGFFKTVTGGLSKAKETVTPEAPTGGVKGMSNVTKGLNTTDMIKGAAAILILSAALFVAAKAFQEFASVKWESVVIGGVALVGLAIIAKSLGGSAAGIIEGAIAIAILGVALIPLAYALNLAAPAIESFGKVLTSVFNGIATVITAAADGISTIFGSLQNVDVVKLLAIGPALFGIGLGLAALGGGSAIGAVGGLFTKLMGGKGPLEMLTQLAALGDPLKLAADSLQGMATALTQVSTALSTLDTSKLKELDKFASNRAMESIVGGAVKGITDFITAPIKAVGEMVGGGEKENIKAGIDLTPMITAINEVKKSVDRLYTKDTTIKMDSTVVGTSLSKVNYQAS